MLKINTLVIGPNGFLGPTWIETLESMGHSIYGIGLDDSQDSVVREKLKAFYSIDLSKNCKNQLGEIILEIQPKNILFNSGVDSPPGSGLPKLSDYSMESWETIFRVNVFGLVQVLQACLITRNKPKNFVAVGSMYAEKSPNPGLYSHYSDKGLTKHPAYGASKAASRNVIMQFATHYAREGILINMISPGSIKSMQDEKFISKMNQKIPIGRLAEAREITSILKFLLEGNSYMIGQNLLIDGGASLW